MDEFAREWTYRTPLVTVTYPKGWVGSLPAERREAAEADGALVVPEPAGADPEKPKRARKKTE